MGVGRGGRGCGGIAGRVNWMRWTDGEGREPGREGRGRNGGDRGCRNCRRFSLIYVPITARVGPALDKTDSWKTGLPFLGSVVSFEKSFEFV